MNQTILTHLHQRYLCKHIHHIQQKILKKLLYSHGLGYAQMRPTGVESNHYAYHLDQLVRSGIIAKKNRRYQLSPGGLALVDRLSQEKMTVRLQSQIDTAIHIGTADGRTLLFKKNFQPYIDRYSLPLGKVHFEEGMPQAAQRELREKTGLSGIPLQHRGVVHLESKIKGVTISKVMYHLFSGQVATPQPLVATARGSCVWMDCAELAGYQCVPGLLAMEQLLDTQPHFFFREWSEDQAEKSK